MLEKLTFQQLTRGAFAPVRHRDIHAADVGTVALLGTAVAVNTRDAYQHTAFEYAAIDAP